MGRGIIIVDFVISKRELGLGRELEAVILYLFLEEFRDKENRFKFVFYYFIYLLKKFSQLYEQYLSIIC